MEGVFYWPSSVFYGRHSTLVYVRGHLTQRPRYPSFQSSFCPQILFESMHTHVHMRTRVHLSVKTKKKTVVISRACRLYTAIQTLSCTNNAACDGEDISEFLMTVIDVVLSPSWQSLQKVIRKGMSTLLDRHKLRSRSMRQVMRIYMQYMQLQEPYIHICMRGVRDVGSRLGSAAPPGPCGDSIRSGIRTSIDYLMTLTSPELFLPFSSLCRNFLPLICLCIGTANFGSHHVEGGGPSRAAERYGVCVACQQHRVLSRQPRHAGVLRVHHRLRRWRRQNLPLHRTATPSISFTFTSSWRLEVGCWNWASRS
jgi:hypothetical protein